MIEFEENIRNTTLLDVAHKMAVAARTAPKACGRDYLEIAIVSGDELKALAGKMQAISVEKGRAFLSRDAENLLKSEVVLLIGTTIQTFGLNCGYCGYDTCEQKPQQVPCFFNANDLGLAIGSAVSIAADSRVDSRVMFSVGVAALELKILPHSKMILGIPLSAMGKSPFFDRN